MDASSSILPDLNAAAEESLNSDEEVLQFFDLNSTPSAEVSSPHNDLFFDLNSEPTLDDDTHIEGDEGDEGDDTNFIPDTEISINRNMSNNERRAVYEMLLQKSVDGKLKKGTTKLVASFFSVHITTVQRIWKRSKEVGAYVDVSNRRINCGRKRVEVDLERIREVPLNQRTTLRSLAHALEMNMSTVHKKFKSGDFRRHSNAIKPHLTEPNKTARLKFCLSMLQQNSIPHDPTFKEMYNIVHIDEKWFYMTKKSEKYYLLHDEEDPLRTCKSKNFITKVMFLVALARPRFDAQGNEVFSGKIGMFPFVTREPAKRNSSHRAAGTIETKTVTSVTRDIVRFYLIEKVIPAIKEKWPQEDRENPIFIQQDNARTHIECNDEEFCQEAKKDGFDIRLMCQPPNSPDLNVLDLGFFRAIQSLQHKTAPTTVDELITVVEKSFEDYSSIKLNRIFLSLQLCMTEIMKVGGSQKYKIPHIGKESLERQGRLPTVMKCDSQLVQDVINCLSPIE